MLGLFAVLVPPRPQALGVGFPGLLRAPEQLLGGAPGCLRPKAAPKLLIQRI